MSGPAATARAGAPTEVRLWSLPLDVAASRRARLERLLDDGERARAAALRSATDRRRFVAAHGLVREILAGVTGVAADAIAFRAGPHGKPALAGPAGVRFNVSHSGDLALCAVTLDREIGVDVEELRPGRDVLGIAARFFSAAEAAALRALGPAERDAGFYACWTRKEAYLKATGAGLAGGLDAFAVSVGSPARVVQPLPGDRRSWTVHGCAPRDGYLAAVVVEGTAARLRWPPAVTHPSRG